MRTLGVISSSRAEVTPLVFSDNFNRANAANPGADWTFSQGSEALPIVGNKIVSTVGHPAAIYTPSVALGANMWAEADVTATSGAYDACQGPSVRLDGSGNNYYFWFNNSLGNYMEVWCRKDMVWTQVGSTVAIPRLAGRARIEAEGSTIRAYLDGVKYIEATDTQIADGYAGIYGGIGDFGSTDSGMSATTDNFRCGNLPWTPAILDDAFTGTSIDTSSWDVYERIGDLYNNEVNCIVPANVRVSGGTLKIDSKFEDYTCSDTMDSTEPEGPLVQDYTSGQIATKITFQYGTVEVRAKIAGGTGLWPCIWMLGHLWQATQAYTANTSTHAWPTGGWWEIDIAEFMSNERDRVNCAVHYPAGESTTMCDIPFNATSRFMVYRLQWSSTSLVWSVDAEDGVGWRTLRTETNTSKIPNTPGFLVIHTAIGGNAVGPPNSSTFPQTMEVDYARITPP